MNSNGVLNSNRFVEKLGIQMLLRNVVIYILLFTHHYPARCFGMNMPKSRDIQAKIPLPQAIWNEFGYVTVNGVNSNIYIHKILRNYENQLTMSKFITNLKVS